MGYALSFALVTIRHKISVLRAGTAHKDEFDFVFQFWLERLQPIHGHEDSGEIAEQASNELVENMTRLDLEQGENHRGMWRRWLRFEDAQQNIMEFSPSLKMLSWQLINLTQPITSTMENQPLNIIDHEGETFSYCECFADRYYCYEDCACQGCVKCVEYEDTIEAAVEEIKSRNKHAFESKIVSISLILLQIGMWY
ncbi:hypothetical protein Acr_20g0001850 [Actinidia rufa]|uniref:Uncharacterized protein n=1 Tax=Actinidia rufa TaxID=165716 RepID=A0A7J0GC59_9ERIC|nr:hypothetical protein Acr_20g0001850 [Actinidia rufa]